MSEQVGGSEATKHSWLRVPGNENAFQELLRLLRVRRAIAFVGAGASAGLYPLWSSLLAELADEALKNGWAAEAECTFWKKHSQNQPQQIADQVQRKLGSGHFGQFLRSRFGPKTGQDGKHYTPIHSALVRLPFRGYVTTNYDPGLHEASLVERVGGALRSHFTWMDTDEVYRWLTGEVFDQSPCPILHAHGCYDKSQSIILGSGGYRDAYAYGVYKRLFESLWINGGLVFVGVGFSDPVFNVSSDSVITEIEARTAAGARNFAIVGIDQSEDYTSEHRGLYRDNYNATALFYRIRPQHDHSELLEILHALNAELASVPSIPELKTADTVVQPDRLPLYQILSRRSPEAARLYLAALHVLRASGNPDAMGLAAHSLRKLMTNMSDLLTQPNPNELHQTLLDRINSLRENLDSSSSSSQAPKHTDQQQDDSRTQLVELCRWAERHFPAEETRVAKVLTALEPSGSRLPPVIHTRVANDWMTLWNYFSRIADFDTGNPDKVEFDQRIAVLETFLMQRLSPNTFKDQDVIDRLLREAEGK